MRYWYCTMCFTLLSILSCANPWAPDEPKATAGSLSYTLDLPEMHPDSLTIRLTIYESSDAENGLVLPLVYFDNPLDSVAGPFIKGLTLIDADGSMLDTISRRQMVGPVLSTIISIPSDAHYPVTIQYGLDFDALTMRKGSFRMPQIHIDENSALLMGSYMFAVPYDSQLPHMWRQNRVISVNLDLPESETVRGVPSTNLTCQNVYELLFIQLALGAEFAGSGSGGHQPFEFYQTDQTDGLKYDWAPVIDQYENILDSIIPLFGRLSEEPYNVFFHPISGGLEGTYSFFIFPPAEAHQSILPVVLAHETFHHTIGIRCGEYDDPWWKEGTAEYLGWVTAGICGYASIATIYNSLIGTYLTNETIDDYPPSSELLRPMIFFQSLYAIAYGKGGQISMLLDHAVREATNNTATLSSVTAQLVHRYDRRAFTRDQMVIHFFETARVDIRPVLERYADRANRIPGDVLDTTFRALARMRAFGQDTSTGFLSQAKKTTVVQGQSPELFFLKR
ncbi:MAG: hypothetical protein ACOC4C_02990 [Fibrobacterota bacterium]